jgi:hypothetical protein
MGLGLYAVHLHHWLHSIARRQLLVLHFRHELLALPADTLRRVASFAGLPGGPLSEAEATLPHANTHADDEGALRLRAIECAVRDELEAFHAPFEKALPAVVNGGAPGDKPDEQRPWAEGSVDMWGEREACQSAT